MADMNQAQLAGRIGATAEDYDIFRFENTEPEVSPSEGFRLKLQRALRDDIDKAVKRRMADLD